MRFIAIGLTPLLLAACGSTGSDGADRNMGTRLSKLEQEVQAMRQDMSTLRPAIERLVQVEGDIKTLVMALSEMASQPVPAAQSPVVPTPAAPAPVAPAPAAMPPVGTRPPVGDPPAPEPAPQGIKPAQDVPVALAPAPPAAPKPPASPNPAPLLALAAPTPTNQAAIGTQYAQLPGSGSLDPPAAGRPAPAPRAGSPTAQAAPTTQTIQPSEPEGRYLFAVHLASYTNAETGTRGWSELRRRHTAVLSELQPRLSTLRLSDGRGPFFRLKAGPFALKDDAESACRTVKARGDFCAVTDFDGAPFDGKQGR